MKANHYRRIASPRTLKIVRQAFDAAWSEITDNYTNQRDIEAARLRLADVILMHAERGERSVAALRDAAVSQMTQERRHSVQQPARARSRRS